MTAARAHSRRGQIHPPALTEVESERGVLAHHRRGDGVGDAERTAGIIRRGQRGEPRDLTSILDEQGRPRAAAHVVIGLHCDPQSNVLAPASICSNAVRSMVKRAVIAADAIYVCQCPPLMATSRPFRDRLA